MDIPMGAGMLIIVIRHCKPSGWCEVQELSVDAKSDDGSLLADSFIRKWCKNQEDAAQVLGMTLLMSGSVLKQQMADAGFENITVREYKIPIGGWPADPKLKEIGNFQLVAMLEGIGGLTVAFWVNCLGWSVEEVRFPCTISGLFLIGRVPARVRQSSLTDLRRWR